MSNQLRIAVFGGAGEIGGNRILLSWGDTAWMLDFGTRSPRPPANSRSS